MLRQSRGNGANPTPWPIEADYIGYAVKWLAVQVVRERGAPLRKAV
jgi:hypothetical protein